MIITWNIILSVFKVVITLLIVYIVKSFLIFKKKCMKISKNIFESHVYMALQGLLR